MVATRRLRSASLGARGRDRGSTIAPPSRARWPAHRAAAAPTPSTPAALPLDGRSRAAPFVHKSATSGGNVVRGQALTADRWVHDPPRRAADRAQNSDMTNARARPDHGRLLESWPWSPEPLDDHGESLFHALYLIEDTLLEVEQSVEGLRRVPG